MYSNIIVLLMIIVPIPVIIRGIKKGNYPYKTILDGIICSGVGIAIIFIIAQLSGNSIGAEVDKAIEEISKVLSENAQVSQLFGIENADKEERIEFIRQIYSVSAQMLSGVLLIMATIISWLEGIIIGKMIKKDGMLVNPVPPLREFSLPRNCIMGWFLIFILSWIMKGIGLSGGDIILLNINILFEFTFSIQGISVVLLFGHLKKIPKAISVIVVIILWFTGIGKMILFFVGIIDLILGLKGRIQNKL